MKKLLILSLSLLSLSAQSATIAFECGLVETPTSTHDSWGLTILGDKVAFFDNDHNSYGKLVSTKGDNDAWEFKSMNPKDPWKVILDDPTYTHETFYAELFIGRKARPQIFECKKVSVASVKSVFEDMAEEMKQYGYEE